MTERTIDYPGLVLGALRAAIAQLLRKTAEEGLPGEHYFYITFRADADGVEMPPWLLRAYPEEMTIVLQNQFWNLRADDEALYVTLRFSAREADLRVPFDAMTAFADPSAEFSVLLAPPAAAPQSPTAEPSGSAPAEPTDDKRSEGGTLIAFDSHRKRD